MFSLKTGKSKYSVKYHVVPNFEVMVGVGYWTISKDVYSSNDCTITYTSAF